MKKFLFALTAALMLGLSGMVLYDYGTTGQALEFCYRQSFDLARMELTDWIGWGICTVWILMLGIPWLQFFGNIDRINRCRFTLINWCKGWDYAFLIFNILLVAGSVYLLLSLLNHPISSYDDGDLFINVAFYLVFSSVVYVPWSMVVIIRNLVCGRKERIGNNKN